VTLKGIDLLWRLRKVWIKYRNFEGRIHIWVGGGDEEVTMNPADGNQAKLEYGEGGKSG
jgi:hypothetical protein